MHLSGARVHLRSAPMVCRSAGRGHPVGPDRVLANCLGGGGNPSPMNQRCVASGSFRAGSLARRASLCTLCSFGVHRALPGFSPHGRIPWFGPGCFHGAHGTDAPFIFEVGRSGCVDVDGDDRRCRNRARCHNGLPMDVLDPLWQRGQNRGGAGINSASVVTGEAI